MLPSEPRVLGPLDLIVHRKKMKYYNLAALLLFLAFNSTAARELKPEEAKHILERAEIIRVAFEENDAQAIADMTHPTLFETLGISKKQFISMTQAGLNQLDAAGVKIISSELKQPSLIVDSTHYDVVFIPRISIMDHLPYALNNRALLSCASSPHALGLLWPFCPSARGFAIRLLSHPVLRLRSCH